MRIFVVNLFCLLITTTSFAQAKSKATLKVLNEQQAPIENATVELLRAKDSALVRTELTDKSGLAEFDNLSFNNYFIRISFVGFNAASSQIFTLSEAQPQLILPSMNLTASAGAQMQNVVVTA